jgi:predicted solute-binding protein
VGSVPYVNAKPLVSHFDRLGPTSPVRVVYDLPSHLPEMLDSGAAQAVLVSSFDSFSKPDRRIAAGCVSTYGDAQSVRLFSKVPLNEIKKLALDASSLTSIHLAQVVLIENYGIRAETVGMKPDLGLMLGRCDACVIIGDKGMTASGEGLQVIDLGAEWHKMTDLPFVWAAWIGNGGLGGDLAAILQEANDWGRVHLDEVIAETQAQVQWPGDSCRSYLAEIMNYELTDRHIEGLRLFQQLLLKHGFLKEDYFPTVVRAKSPKETVPG